MMERRKNLNDKFGFVDSMKIKDFIDYEQPNEYIVESDRYNSKYSTPVLTAGQSFILGYTNESKGVYEKGPCIIFDDFTTSVHYVDFPFKVKSSAMKILTTKSNANIKYCYYLLLSLSKMPPNHKRQWISTTSEKSYVLPSMDKQISIVKQLDLISDTIANYTNQNENLDNLVKARFIEMFKSVNDKVTIGSLCDVTSGYSFKSKDINSSNGIKLLQIGNVFFDNVNWETVNYLPDGYNIKYSKFLLNEGDIVVALTRPIIQSLGNVKACVVRELDVPCLLNQRVGRITPKKNIDANLEFIYECLMMNDFTKYVESCCIGCSQPNISVHDIENYLVPNVSLKQQESFVLFKKQVDKSREEVKRSLEKTQQLYDSLMQEYFG